MTPPLYIWKKLSSTKWEDVWQETLSAYADRLAISFLPGKRSLRIEVFALSKEQAEFLLEHYGGKVLEQKTAQEYLSLAARAPLRIRGRLIVVSSEEEKASLGAERAPILCIPSGMAFGTGDHATTASCLRLLEKAARTLPADWECLDLGCGSGILALAALVFGAQRADAADFDPAAVRITRENAKANGLARKIKAMRLDVRTWVPDRTWPLVAANIYSSLLIETAPTLAKAVAQDGILIFSGVLRAQEEETVAALTAAGFRIEQIVKKGKWIAGWGIRLALTRAKSKRRKA